MKLLVMQGVSSSDPTNVLNCDVVQQQKLTALLRCYGLEIVPVELNQSIPGSFFGDREAGLIGNKLYLRYDTPVHSALHEACHYICMTPDRRSKLDTDAEGDYQEENGVCFLQILLADRLDAVGKERIMDDMDSWGYTFRLGSAKAWFENDAEDASQWLITHQIIDTHHTPTGRLR